MSKKKYKLMTDSPWGLICNGGRSPPPFGDLRKVHNVTHCATGAIELNKSNISCGTKSFLQGSDCTYCSTGTPENKGVTREKWRARGQTNKPFVQRDEDHFKLVLALLGPVGKHRRKRPTRGTPPGTHINPDHLNNEGRVHWISSLKIPTELRNYRL